MTAVAVGLLSFFALRHLRGAIRSFHGARRGLSPEREALGVGAAFRRALTINALNPKALTTWLAILAIFPVARAGAGDSDT